MMNIFSSNFTPSASTLKWTRWVTVLLFVILVLTGSAAIWSTKPTVPPIAALSYQRPARPMDTPNQTLRIAPLFNLPELNPKHATELSRSLQSMRGKWILLHFWASWCTPCLGELTEWIEFGNSFHDEPIQFIAVSTDENREDAYKILPAEKLPAHIHSLIDTTHQTSEQYGTFQFPETYLLNPELKIVTKWVGPQPWNTAPVKEFFEKLLKPEPTHSTESVRQPDPTSTGSPTNYSAPVTEEAANQEAPDPAQPQTNPNHPALHPVDLH